MNRRATKRQMDAIEEEAATRLIRRHGNRPDPRQLQPHQPGRGGGAGRNLAVAV